MMEVTSHTFKTRRSEQRRKQENTKRLISKSSVHRNKASVAKHRDIFWPMTRQKPLVTSRSVTVKRHIKFA
jgi:hypothetical protein